MNAIPNTKKILKLNLMRYVGEQTNTKSGRLIDTKLTVKNAFGPIKIYINDFSKEV